MVYFNLSRILKRNIYIYIWNLHGNQPVHLPCMYHILQLLNFHYVLWKICSSSLPDWTNSFQFGTDCDEYSLVLHRRSFCTIFILAFTVTIITRKETKLQKLAITFDFLSTRDSHCKIQFEKWEIFGYRGTGQRCVKFIVELSLLVWRLKRVAKVGIEQRGK